LEIWYIFKLLLRYFYEMPAEANKVYPTADRQHVISLSLSISLSNCFLTQ